MKQPVSKRKSSVTCDAVHARLACIGEGRGGWRGIEPSMLNTSSSPRYSVMSWSMYLHTTVRFFEPLAVEKVGASAVTSQLNLPERAKLTSRRVTWLLFEFSSWNRATCVQSECKWMYQPWRYRHVIAKTLEESTINTFTAWVKLHS